MIKVSIVLSIYNVEKYLDRCIQSVVNQTYSNLEILLIDDGSPDSCPEICEKWAIKDNRIKVIHKKNAGLGMARNTGIENATGEFICFFDSDDYIDSTLVEKCVESVKKNYSDVVCYGFFDINQNGKIIEEHKPFSKKEVYKGEEIENIILPELIAHDDNSYNIGGLFLSAWAGLYSLKIIKNHGWRFVSEREIISEDVYSLLTLYKNVKIVSIIPESLYYYCQNEKSLTHTYREDRYSKIRSFYLEAVDVTIQLNYCSEVRERLMETFISFVTATIKQIANARIDTSERKRLIGEILEDKLFTDCIRDRRKKTNLRSRKLYYWLIINKQLSLLTFLAKCKR